jgi:dCMP deaminase
MGEPLDLARSYKGVGAEKVYTQQDKEMMLVAHEVAKNSPDLHTKVGCVITTPNRDYLQGGFNRFADGLPWTVDRAQRPEKYKRTLHAEMLAIMQALYLGYPLSGSTLYSTQIPCNVCALVIIEVGIKRVVSKPFPSTSLAKWVDEQELVAEMFAETGIDLILNENREQIQ